MKRLFPLLLILLTFGVEAQTPPARTATITFSRPAQYTDGTAIPATTALTYKVLQGARGATKPQVGTITATATTINTGLPAGETCWQIITVANGVDSALSNEACKAFPFPTEAVTITVT